MKELRKIDDNIMLRMNKTDTHSNAACAEFFHHLSKAYVQREQAVNYCLEVLDRGLDKQNDALAKNPGDNDLKNKLYSEETKRRWIFNEFTVEDIVRSRSLRVFNDKCRSFEMPADFTEFLNKRK
ncbi:hypothetical protein IWQ60_012148 [Tieghemiomyces parasiticus]|uniref:Uncharacterized protein n=1 Tax=Tieghemiomyces parasiticus TaxID=78921 RepID=A0A9W8DGN9_9FUNG|nr:hypothetical protein IWQ60_012148 [Tieghemiomyces parasiticus]